MSTQLWNNTALAISPQVRNADRFITIVSATDFFAQTSLPKTFLISKFVINTINK